MGREGDDFEEPFAPKLSASEFSGVSFLTCPKVQCHTHKSLVRLPDFEKRRFRRFNY
ncbi:MAG: hypothetical protein F6K58_24015 [Symploca sp. SIO2E9]|nr:hypothetical protein [Symploca sp. SIO2E9]